MKNHLISILLVTSLFTINGFSQSVQALNFEVSGFESNVGQAILELFRPQDKVPQKPFMTVKSTIAAKEAAFSLKNLAYGDYAVIIVHDQNSNGEIDHSWGVPSEPLGFSNNWELSLFSGMPSFEKLRFTYSKTNTIIKIKME